MGYWLQIDPERHIIVVHNDTSTHHRCVWLGKKAGRAQPANWRYQEALLGSFMMINNTKFSLKPCSLPECMKGTFSVPVK